MENFKYIKDTGWLKFYCPGCKTNLEITIPENIYRQPDTKYAVTFRYVHRKPAHSLTLFIDDKRNIRGHEFGDSIQLSNEIINNLFDKRQICEDSDSGQVIATIFNTFTTVLDAKVSHSEKILYEVGLKLGEKFEPVFQKTDDIGSLLGQMAIFWKKHGLGRIDELKLEPELISFNVYDCIECSHMPNIGRPVCKMDEGLLTKLLELKFHKKFDIKEVKCYASGYNYCNFQIK